MFFGSVNRLYPIGCVCVLLRGSSDRHSGCWNKKSRPRTLTKSSHLFSSFQHLTRSLSLFLVTLACFPLVTTATKTNAIASTQTPSSVHSHNNTNVASQNDLSDFFVSFNLQQTQMITVLAQNMTVGYLNALMDDFGTNGSIGKEQLSQMIEKIIRVYKQDEDAEHRDHNTKSGGDVDFSSCSRYSMNGTSLNYSMGKDEQSLDPNQLLSCQVNKVRRNFITFLIFSDTLNSLKIREGFLKILITNNDGDRIENMRSFFIHNFPTVIFFKFTLFSKVIAGKKLIIIKKYEKLNTQFNKHPNIHSKAV